MTTFANHLIDLLWQIPSALLTTVVGLGLRRMLKGVQHNQASIKVTADNAAVSASQAQQAAEVARDGVNELRASAGSGKSTDIRFRGLEARMLELESRGARNGLAGQAEGDRGGVRRDRDGGARVDREHPAGRD